MSESRATSQIRSLALERERWSLRQPFRITGYTFTEIEFLLVTISQGEHVGRGEATGVYYLDDSPAAMLGQIERIRDEIEQGADRARLRALLPPGGARNALDCALWELEGRCAAAPVSELLQLKSPRSLETMFTVGAGSVDEMVASAVAYREARILKLKLTGERTDIERVGAVRSARPDVRLAIDANQGYTRASLEDALPAFMEAGVSLIEQPLPIGREDDLAGLNSPIPLAADESVQALDDIEPLAGLFDIINIKLDKCGGLTEGLAMLGTARAHGFQVMVGNMVGTSLSVGPAFLLGQFCDFVDLDGPVHLAGDRKPSVHYADGYLHCPADVWGAPHE